MKASSSEIKTHLLQMISETEDEKILNKIQAYLTTLRSKEVDWWELTTVHEKESIYKSLKMLDEGKGISHLEVKKKTDKFFGRK